MRFHLMAAAAVILSACANPGAPPDPGPLRFETLDAGAEHTCGLATDAEVYCWGANSERQLGSTTRSDANPVPERVLARPLALTAVYGGTEFSCGLLQGVGPACWGNRVDGMVPVATDQAVTGLRVGYFACGLTDASKVLC